MNENNTSKGLIIHVSYSGPIYLAPQALAESWQIDALTTKQGKPISKEKAENIVKGYINKGIVPTEKFGRYRLVNMIALFQQALEAEFYPGEEKEADSANTTVH